MGCNRAGVMPKSAKIFCVLPFLWAICEGLWASFVRKAFSKLEGPLELFYFNHQPKFIGLKYAGWSLEVRQ